jgi:hypothetical protein
VVHVGCTVKPYFDKKYFYVEIFDVKSLFIEYPGEKMDEGVKNWRHL